MHAVKCRALIELRHIKLVNYYKGKFKIFIVKDKKAR